MDMHAIQNTSINIAPGIHLSELQRKHVGLVLDLFQAKGEVISTDEKHPTGDYWDSVIWFDLR
jgi:hypothetical protein